ncbi:MAG: energy transducer TonB [Rhodothermales bacterium]|nr:energy transducer TonB [Rhodothermales bacterium]
MPAPPSHRPRPGRLRTETHGRAYALRILAATAASLLLTLGAFRLWPVEERAPREALYAELPPETIEIELIEPTQQARALPPPPPPAPLPPVEVPDDVEIPDDPLVFEEMEMSPIPDYEPGPPDAAPGPPTEGTPEPAGPAFVERADVSPRAVRQFLPETPPEARREGIRARVRIRVLVDERGRPQEMLIVERLLLKKGDEEEPVAELGYGIEEAALSAAERFQFRPGRHDGRPVQSYAFITVSVGV